MRALVGVVMLLLAGAMVPVSAQELETIALRHRTVDQLLPTLREIAEPGTVVSGMQSTLIVRGSRRAIDQMKRALTALDVMPRRLLISVRTDAATEHQGGGRVYSSRGAADERVDQTVQVLEGNPAQISVGQSVPITAQSVTRSVFGATVSEGVTYRDVQTGFFVIARLNGERVSLEINQVAQTVGSGSGLARRTAPEVSGQPAPQFSGQRISSQLAGRLGEWIDLGGTSQDASASRDRVYSSTQAARRDNRRVWVKVDELP